MNTDTRRAVFCCIMGAEDTSDAFEHLLRLGLKVHLLLGCCPLAGLGSPCCVYLIKLASGLKKTRRLCCMLRFWWPQIQCLCEQGLAIHGSHLPPSLLQGEAEREMVRVAVECCLQEAAWNPYYSLLLSRLTAASTSHAVTLQCALCCSWTHIVNGLP